MSYAEIHRRFHLKTWRDADELLAAMRECGLLPDDPPEMTVESVIHEYEEHGGES